MRELPPPSFTFTTFNAAANPREAEFWRQWRAFYGNSLSLYDEKRGAEIWEGIVAGDPWPDYLAGPDKPLGAPKPPPPPLEYLAVAGVVTLSREEAADSRNYRRAREDAARQGARLEIAQEAAPQSPATWRPSGDSIYRFPARDGLVKITREEMSDPALYRRAKADAAAQGAQLDPDVLRLRPSGAER